MENWSAITKELLKSELESRNITIGKLKELLHSAGIDETKASLSNKLSRGTFSARFLIQVLQVIGASKIEIPNLQNYIQMENHSQTHVNEPAAYFSTGQFGWNEHQGFFYNSFDSEWYVDISDKSLSQNLDGGKVVSLFTGSGGLDIGLEQAGFDTVACVEIDDDCKETLIRNRPDWTIIEGTNNGDIRNVSVESILDKTKLSVGEAALVVGGAPCQPFSNIGKREGVGDQKNGGDLFQEFVRVVGGILPKAFIFENVVGITQQKHKDVLSYMQSCLSGLGYSITYRIMNAADYGVPQKRNRFILIGLRSGPPPALPMPTNFKSNDVYREFCFQIATKPQNHCRLWQTVRDAFSAISDSDRNRPDNVCMNISEPVRQRMELIGPGENFHVLPMNMRPNCWKTGKHQGQDTFGRLKLDEPSVTIRTAAYNPAKGRYIHPIENRGLNAIELASLQGFPRDWRFYCKRYDNVTLTSAGKQIGNAVPPPLAKAIGLALNIQLTTLAANKLKKCI